MRVRLGYRGVTTHCDQLLTTHGPVVEVLIRIENHADGYHLWLRHRHHAGLFMDCPSEEYDRLDDGTLVDVVDATLCGLLAYHPWC